MVYGFFLLFINIYSSVKVGFCEDYSLHIYSKQVDGISFNEGLFVYGGQRYDLPCTIDVTEGLHLINYVPDSDYRLSYWETLGNKLRKPESDNPNMIKISESGTLIINYETAPPLDIEFLHPTENSFLDINENDIELHVKISYMGNGVEDVHVTLDVNGTYIDSQQSTENGTVIFHYIKRKNTLKFNVMAIRDGYKDTKIQMIYNNFYELTTNPENGQILTDKPCRVYVGFHTKRGAIENTDVRFHVNNQSIETVIGGNGYCSVTIDKPNLGVNHFYAVLVTEYDQVIFSDPITFDYYYDLEISSFNIEKDRIDNYTDPNIWLKALVSSYNNRFSNVKVTFFVDDVALGYNYSDENGIASFKYRMMDPTIFDWYAVASRDGFVDAITNEKQFDLLASVPILEGQVLSPTGIELSNSTSKVIFSVSISHSNEPVKESLVNFYINHNVIGENYTNHQGIASISYYPLYEAQFYEWNYDAQKTNYQPYISQNQAIYYPIQLPKVSITYTYKSKNRTDIGSPSTIGFKLTYENSTPITKRIVELSNSARNVTDDEGWVYFQVTSDSIGEKQFYVKRIIDRNIGEIIEGKHVLVTWDKILLTIHCEKSRVNVGEDVALSVTGYYVYDKTDFIGEVYYNDTLTEYFVGNKKISISNINDNVHGLTSYECDALNVIWDRVKFKIRNNLIYEKNNINDTVIKGIYEYDNTEFIGTFDHDMPELNEYGIYKIEIVDIKDDLYGISVFDDENLQIIYDEIDYHFHAINISPGKIQCSLELKSKFTNNNQLFFIKINDKIYDLIDGDTLNIDFNDWSIVQHFDISIISTSNLVKTLEISYIYYENVFTYIFSLALLVSTIYNIIKTQLAHFLINYFQEHIHSFNIENTPPFLKEERIQKEDSPFTPQEISPGITLNRIYLEDNPISDSSWIGEPQDITHHGFESSFSSEKFIIIGLLFFIATVSYFLFNQNISLILFIISTLCGLSVSLSYFINKYNTFKIVKSKKEYIISYTEQVKKSKIIQDTMDDLKKNNKILFNDASQKIIDINSEREKLKIRVNKRINEEENGINDRLNTVIENKRNLLSNGSQELEKNIEKMQRNWVPSKLSFHKIRYSEIPQVGDVRVKTLESYGINTAADFTDVTINYINDPNGEAIFQLTNGRSIQIPGIGPKIGEEIKTWRDRLETTYRQDMQKSLIIETNKIRDQYSKKLQNIEQNEQDLKDNLKRVRQRAVRNYEVEEKKLIYQVNIQKKQYENVSKNMKNIMYEKNIELGESLKEKGRIEYELKNFDKINIINYVKTSLKKAIFIQGRSTL